MHEPPAHDVARSIALMNQKGGVGKTTTAVNLAAGLARLGRRTLLIDLDPQGHATLHLGAEPEPEDPTVYDVLLDPEGDLETPLLPARDNLWLLPSTTDLAAAEPELADASNRDGRLRRALERLRGRFDFILVDCPPSLGLLTLNALAATREVLIPMQAHFLALQGVGKLMETVRLVGQRVNPDLRIAGVVLCMHEDATRLAREVVADLEAFFDAARDQDVPWRDARVFQPPVRRNIKLAESPSFGQTIFEYAPGAPGAEDYDRLARAMADQHAPHRAEIVVRPGAAHAARS